jgi:amino acid adenylation domain-containing protein
MNHRIRIAPVAGRACHSLTGRVAAPDRLADAWQELRVAAPQLAAGRVWSVATGEPAAAPRAAAAREAERHRALRPGAALRVVHLRHDDCAEVVLVARSAVVPACCLAALAGVLVAPAGDRPDRLAGLAVHTAGRHAGPAPPPAAATELGLAEDGTPERVLEAELMLATMDVEGLVAATGRALARVTGQEQLTVVVTDADGGWSGWRAGSAGAAAPVTGRPGPAAAVITLTALPAEDYLPVLAPTHPLTVIGHRLPGGAARVACHVDAAVTGLGAGGAVLAELARMLPPGRPVGRARWAEGVRPVPGVALPAAVRPPAGDSSTLDSGTRSLPDAFLREAGRRPAAVAVTDGTTSLTYRQLDEASAAVARGLVRRGVRPGDRVAVCLERSTRVVVALLAVLRAGGCYVPLDPQHPPARRAGSVRDAGARLLITGGATGDSAGEHGAGEHGASEHGAAELKLAELATGAGGPGPSLPAADPDRPAYIIYTSGTTGQPKGVVVAHRSVLALVAATRHGFRFGPDDVWTMFHSPAFDFSVWEMWGCLLTGGRLHVVPHWTARSPVDVADLLVRERVSVLNQTPSAFARLAPALLASPGRVPLRLVIFGGEPLPASALADWIRRHPVADCRLVNMFGITETTVHVTWAEITAREVLAGSKTVGRPIPGWTVSVRDRTGRELPPYLPGEIWVGGAGLAVGYHQRGALTAERFVTDPGTGERYYRSGDLGRLHPDGSLDHLGRVDDQVKVRGYRVELGEIRAALLDDPAVGDAVVTIDAVDRDGHAEPTIHAWVVPATATVPGPELRRRLRRRLPDYMVPSAVSFLTAVPLTVNGKVDRERLAEYVARDAPAGAAPPAGHGGDGSGDPHTELAAVWRDLFGDDADLAENFFDLGGNSLLALRLGTLLQERGLPMVSPREVYLHPTVAELAALLARTRPAGDRG